MLRECVEIFTEIYNEKGERFITDSYELEPGDYFIVKSDGSYSHIKIERIKKIEENSNRRTIEDYEYLAERDYLSRLLDMNKPIDGKKQIHSNNYLSFFVKNNVLSEKKKELEESIEKYYEILKNPFLKYDKGEKKRVYTQLEEKLGKPSEEKIQKNYEWIKENLYKIKEEIKDGKEYIKIFFDEDIEEYKKENERYVIPNIYNSVDYNVIINDETYGLPNNNLNLNSKKPYLENKTRKEKYTVPYLLNEEEVFKQKKFFDYIYNMANSGKRNIYISSDKKEIIPLETKESLSDNFTGYYLRIRKDKSESAIERYDIISDYRAEIYPEIKILDCLGNGDKGKLEYGSSIKKNSELAARLNNLLFNGKLYGIIFENLKDLKIFDEKIKNIANQYKEVFFELLYKGDIKKFAANYRKIFLELIKNSLCKKDYITEAYDMFNLMASIGDSIKQERGMTVNKHQEIKEKFRNIFETGVGEIENDEEYFFALGQLAKFLISRNRITVKTHELAVRVIESRDIEGLKREIYKLFRKYAYDIGFYSTKFNTLYERILGYEVESEEINMDRLLGGYLADSLIYEKSVKEENETNNGSKEINGEENE
ncbi:hypothetical protein [Fusobacterium sp. THCT1E2]